MRRTVGNHTFATEHHNAVNRIDPRIHAVLDHDGPREVGVLCHQVFDAATRPDGELAQVRTLG